MEIQKYRNNTLRRFQELPVELLRLVDKINAILMLDPLAEEEVLILSKFIYSEYKDLSLEDIEDSIFKAKSGALDCNSATYKKLDIDFFGRVLNAYRKYKNRKVAELNRLEEQKALLALPFDNLEYEKKASYEFLCKVFYEEKTIPYLANWVLAYEYMIESNLINVPNTDKIKFREEVIAEIKYNIQMDKLRGKYSNQLSALSDKVYIKHECIKKALLKYFQDGKFKTI